MNRLTARWVRKAEADVTSASELDRAELALNDVSKDRTCPWPAETVATRGRDGKRNESKAIHAEIEYMRAILVRRGLVAKAGDWRLSSAACYAVSSEVPLLHLFSSEKHADPLLRSVTACHPAVRGNALGDGPPKCAGGGFRYRRTRPENPGLEHRYAIGGR